MIDYEQYIGVTPDFPKKGISFKDISPLIRNPQAFQNCIDDLAKLAEEFKPDIICGPESRAFIFGAPLALAMNTGFVMVRKAGKLPGETKKMTYNLEYGTATIEIPAASFKPGMRVLMVDDLMATGGTFKAIRDLIESCGAICVGAITFINLEDLHGEKVVGVPCRSLVNLKDGE